MVRKPVDYFSRPWNTYDVDSPAWVLLVLDSLEEALDSVLWIRTGELSSLLTVQGLGSLVSPNVNLGVNVTSVLFDEFKGVTGVSMHIMVPIGSPTVREEDHNLMNGLGVLRQVILFKFTSFISGNLDKILKFKHTQNISTSLKCV